MCWLIINKPQPNLHSGVTACLDPEGVPLNKGSIVI